jgi:hypothetical protein
LSCRDGNGRRGLARLSLALCAAGLFASAPAATASPLAAPTNAPTPAVTDRPDSELVLLAVEIRGLPTSATLPCYQDSGRVWLPVGGLARALGLPLEPDLATGRVKGSTREPPHEFDLDPVANRCRRDEERQPIPPGAFELHSSDVYLETHVLATWLALDVEVDLHTALLNVIPREPLPIERHRQRSDRARQVLAGDGNAEPPATVHAMPYRVVSWPFSDHTLALVRRAPGFGTSPSIQYSLDASGDLLWMESRTRLEVDDPSGVTDARFTLRRAESEPVLLGPLKAREVAFGDVFDPGLELFTIPRSGRGASISRYPSTTSEQFGRQSFEGPLPTGWDAELYRNGDLVGYQAAGSTPEYQFSDVPLLYGANEFVMVLHGPEGQTRIERRALNLATSLVPRGEVLYRLTAYDPANARARAAGELSAGLTSRLSATARALAPDLEHGGSPAGAVGLRLAHERWFLKGDVAADSARGSILDLGLATTFGPVGMWGEWAALDRFHSEVFDEPAGPIQDRGTLRLDVRPPARARIRVPMSLEWRRDRLESGQAADRFTHFVAGAIPGLGFSHRLEVLAGPVPGGRQLQTRGSCLASHGGRNLLMRGELEYSISHGPRADRVALIAETWLAPGGELEAGIQQEGNGEGTSTHLAWNRTRGRLGVNLRTDFDPRHGAAGRLVLSMSLCRDPRDGAWSASALPRAGSGAASAAVFLDQNGNGRRDDGEPPLTGITLRADPPGTEAETDGFGIARLEGLVAGRPAHVRLTQAALEDPMWTPESIAVTVLPRAGTTAIADFPVLPGGEINGVVTLANERGEIRPAAAIPIELVDAVSGAVVRSTRSAFDGYYDFAGLKPAAYTLRVTPPEALRKSFVPVALDFVVPPRGELFDGINLSLRPVAPLQVESSRD